MDSRSTRNRLIIAPAVVAVLWGAAWLQPAEAQMGDGSVRFVSRGVLGIAPGQMLRFSVVNANPDQGSAPVRAQVLLYDAQGNVLARSEDGELPPGQFRTFDFNRDDLSAPGDPGSGRLQVHSVIQVSLQDGTVRAAEGFPASIELVDDSTGKTVLAYPTGSVGWIKLSPDA